jgi:dihydrofolate synthase/folylpolyglutamate synthase
VLYTRGWKTGNEIVQKALPKVKKLTGLHGRWEIIHRHPDIILEVAHNEEGVRQMAEQIELCTYHHLHIVLGIVKDKETDKILSHLPRHATYYFTYAHIPRAMDAGALQQHAAKFDLQGNVYNDVNTALDAAKNKASKDDMILVCGSIFLVGELDAVK